VGATVKMIRIHPVHGEPGLELDSVGVSTDRLEGDRPKGAPVHLVSQQAVDRSGQEAPRANLLLDLPQGDERSWVGQEVALGEVVLRVTKVPSHCLGVYAEVVTPGRINLGDAVEPRG